MTVVLFAQSYFLWESAFRYKILKELGDGTCGSVYKAINIETSEIVSGTLLAPVSIFYGPFDN